LEEGCGLPASFKLDEVQNEDIREIIRRKLYKTTWEKKKEEIQ